MHALTLALLADDPLLQDGAEAALRHRPGVHVLPGGQTAAADVVVMLVEQVTESVLTRMERIAADSPRPSPRILLVADTVSEVQFLRGIRFGLCGVLLRGHADFTDVLSAAEDCRRGRSPVPGPLVRALLAHVRSVQRDAGAPGVLDTRFRPRDLAIVELIGRGCRLADIAEQLGYSERTVKSAVASLCAQLGLRNRTHVVAHALRTGLI
ncbi:response regulator transcription factor [Streptomyces shenzhenensis]|uniref:helix-turn-helix transcriptional regulator n=1 Tax=Streptomyces shenzhenensis TaxID=943815 RepID=UPI003D8F8C2B